MKSKSFYALLISTSLVLFTYFVFFFYKQAVEKPALPFLGQVQDFSLLDSEGKEFTFNKIKGRVWIADFFFTTCSDICPLMTKHLANLHQSLKIEKNITIVSISVNPEYDTPAVLAQYAQKFNADTKKWFFLTGPREIITDLAVKSFKLGSISEPIFHSPSFVLVDRHGLIRGYYDGTKEDELGKLLKDAAVLLKDY